MWSMNTTDQSKQVLSSEIKFMRRHILPSPVTLTTPKSKGNENEKTSSPTSLLMFLTIFYRKLKL